MELPKYIKEWLGVDGDEDVEVILYKERRTEYERVVIVNKQYWDRDISQIQHLKT